MDVTPNLYKKIVDYYDIAIILGILCLVIPSFVPFYMFSLLLLTPYLVIRLFLNPDYGNLSSVTDNHSDLVMTSKIKHYNDVTTALNELNTYGPDEFPDHIIVDLKYQDEVAKEFINIYNLDFRPKYPKTEVHFSPKKPEFVDKEVNK